MHNKELNMKNRRLIVLDADQLTNRKSAHAYLEETFEFPDYYGHNLDALHDCLSEIDEETVVIIEKEQLLKMCLYRYAYRILTVLNDAAKENPNLSIRFTD